MRPILRALMLLLLAAPCLAGDGDAARRRVAVIGFQNLRPDPASDWIGAATAETLTTKLTGFSALLVVERSQVQRLVAEQRFSLSDLADADKALKVGRILSAQSLVLGSFALAGGRIQFNARIVDVATGEVLNAASLVGSEADVFALTAQCGDALLQSLGRKVVVREGGGRVEAAEPARVSADEKARLATRPTRSEAAYKAFGQGMDCDGRQRWAEAAGHFAEATRLDPDYADAWRWLGISQHSLGRADRAQESYAKAEALYRQAGDERMLGVVARNLGIASEDLGRRDEALERYRFALAVARRTGDEPRAAIALQCFGSALWAAGRFDEAGRAFDESLALSRRLGDEITTAGTLTNLGSLQWSRRQYEAAQASFEASLAITRRLGDEAVTAMTLSNLGNLHATCGRLPQALECYGAAIEASRRLGDEPSLARALHGLSGARERVGDLRAALEAEREAAAIAARLKMPEAAADAARVRRLEALLGTRP